ncbi:hypothetical protein [Vreelandella massiliensis]|uniref:hypothetical protein n=1 Tax=Vreelandella massiliensis TaxID=1816686 RepID=UPI00096A63D9|nr:hypothetical protein [Halomonas massiliensis]
MNTYHDDRYVPLVGTLDLGQADLVHWLLDRVAVDYCLPPLGSNGRPPLYNFLTHVGIDEGEYDATLEGRLEQSCWVWLGCRNHQGQGQFRMPPGLPLESRTLRAHEALWGMLFGPLPPGDLLRQHCGDPRCVNPYHQVRYGPLLPRHGECWGGVATHDWHALSTRKRA